MVENDMITIKPSYLGEKEITLGEMIQKLKDTSCFPFPLDAPLCDEFDAEVPN